MTYYFVTHPAACSDEREKSKSMGQKWNQNPLASFIVDSNRAGRD
jgi:hypothetical protein